MEGNKDNLINAASFGIMAAISITIVLFLYFTLTSWPSRKATAMQRANAVCEANWYTTYKRPTSWFILETPTQVKCIKIIKTESTWFYNL